VSPGGQQKTAVDKTLLEQAALHKKMAGDQITGL
jgi:hypothetical protein